MSSEIKMLTVQAKRLGFYGNQRRKEGVIFQMAEKDYYYKDKDGKPIIDRHGKPIVCQWVDLIEDEEKPKPKAKAKGKAEEPGEDVI